MSKLTKYSIPSLSLSLSLLLTFALSPHIPTHFMPPLRPVNRSHTTLSLTRKVAVSRDFWTFFILLIQPIWAPVKQVKIVSLKNLFLRRFSKFLTHPLAPQFMSLLNYSHLKQIPSHPNFCPLSSPYNSNKLPRTSIYIPSHLLTTQTNSLAPQFLSPLTFSLP